MKVVQIGANKGHDDVYNFLTGSVGIEFLLLVEPISFHIEDLKKCYGDFKNVYVEQIAIVPEPIASGKILIYYNEADGPGYEISSLDAHYTGNAKSMEVECKTITQLLDKYEIKELDYLFIDAEGWDDKIILSLDLKKYLIRNIEYEHLHIGKGNELEIHLTSNGYKKSNVIPSRNTYNAAWCK